MSSHHSEEESSLGRGDGNCQLHLDILEEASRLYKSDLQQLATFHKPREARNIDPRVTMMHPYHGIFNGNLALHESQLSFSFEQGPDFTFSSRAISPH